MKGLTSLSVLLFLTTCKCYSRSGMYMNGYKMRSPSVFRPGPSLLRNWMGGAGGGSHRFMTSQSNRNPYFAFKGSSRFQKPLSMMGGPWRTALSLHSPVTSPITPTIYDYFHASPSIPPISIHGDRGPIRTIPAPDLSLSDKPIVVADNDLKFPDRPNKLHKTSYEVTEKSLDTTNTTYQPKGFSHHLAQSKTPLNFASPDLLQLIRSPGSQIQLNDPFSFPLLHQPQLIRQTALGPQLTLQAFNAIMQPSLSTDANLLQQNVLFKPDPAYVHKLQNQFYPRYPYEFFPTFPAESFAQTNLFLPDPIHQNIVRHTEEGSLQNVAPSQQIVVADIKPEPIDSSKDSNSSIAEVKEADATSIPFTQVPENAVNVMPNGVTALPTISDSTETIQEISSNSTNEKGDESSGLSTELKPYFVPFNGTINSSEILTPIHGSPFSKDGVINATYSFLKSDKHATSKDGAVLAGHIVEGSVLEDDDYEKEREKRKQEKAPVRLRMPPELITTTEKSFRYSIKTRKSNFKKHSSNNKVEIDEKTGEPVIRIYANSYKRGEKISTTPKSSINRGQSKMRLKASEDYDWKADSAVKSLDHDSSDYDRGHVSQFGLRLRSRMDDFLPIFVD